MYTIINESLCFVIQLANNEMVNCLQHDYELQFTCDEMMFTKFSVECSIESCLNPAVIPHQHHRSNRTHKYTHINTIFTFALRICETHTHTIISIRVRVL